MTSCSVQNRLFAPVRVREVTSFFKDVHSMEPAPPNPWSALRARP